MNTELPPPPDSQVVFRRGFFLGSLESFHAPPAELFSAMVDAARAAEQAGFDAIFVSDHMVQSSLAGGAEVPLPEAFTVLGALAAKTESARLGTLVSPVIFRNPAHYAKIVSTLDWVSGGRAIAGLGAGWDADETVAYGIDMPAVGERMDRLDEALTIFRLMTGEDTPSFAGDHFRIEHAHNVPRPPRQVPILVGGGGERRTLRLAAQHAHASNFGGGDLDLVVRKLAALDEHCAAVGRDPRSIQRTVGMPRTPDMADPGAFRRAVEERVALGVSGIVQGASPDLATIEAWGRVLADVLP